ncbi:MAG: hypothetical protein IJ880_15420 [Bacilli bacterium]|nr:hypothetical protein [Bacilli bacterium]
MSVFRINKNKNYTIMSNYHLKDKNLSLKAKGLLSLMLSLPDNWDYSIKGLEKICKESEGAIKSTLEELKRYNYLLINKERNEKGQFIWIYDIFEASQPYPQNPPMDKPPMENQVQLNTKEIKTKNKRKDKKKNKDNNEYNGLDSLYEN